jgi:dienelactone hydrolase
MGRLEELEFNRGRFQMTREGHSCVWIKLVPRWAFVGLAALATGTALAEASLRPLTPTDAFATTRFMPADRSGREWVSISPDGQRYVIRLVRGDPERHGLWVDVLSGSLQSLNGAVPESAAHLFSTGRGVLGYGGAAADSQASKSPITWIDNRRVAFLFSDQKERRQIVTLDVVSKRRTFETRLPMQVQSFDMAPNGVLVYLADPPPPPKQPLPTSGFVVPEATNEMSLAEGYFDGTTIHSLISHAIWFVKRRGLGVEPVAFPGRAASGGYAPRQQVRVSPDGTHAILTAPANSVPKDWDGYLGHTRGYNITLERDQFNAARADPAGVDAGDIRQFYILDVLSHTARPLWNAVAPIGDWQGSWSTDGRRIVLTPIPIPIAEQSETLSDVQTVVFDIVSGEHWVLSGVKTVPDRVLWINGDEFAIENRGKEGLRACYLFKNSGWQAHGCEDSRNASVTTSKIKVRVKEDLNTPPTLVATDEGTAEERVVLDPNPALRSRFALGRVEFLQGVLSTGESWTASLTMPTRYVSGQRYPLVIQFQGGDVTADRFALYGLVSESGLGPCLIATYAAQMLAGRGIAVLELNAHANYAGPKEVETTQRAFEELANRMVTDGVADPERIGISGFSRTGYFAYQALAHSAMRFAAAVVADNVDYSYLQVVLENNYADGASVIGAPAFGNGLKNWLDRATGFNVDHIHAPVLLIGQNGGFQAYILSHWEILSRLRQLQRPVEMYLMPDIEAHPAHVPQNPDQVIAVQERAVDWFDFWLNGHEMPGSEKAAQYERWRALKRQGIGARTTDLRQPGGSEPSAD